MLHFVIVREYFSIYLFSLNISPDTFFFSFALDKNTTVSGISLNNLILSEENMTRYYRYDGSLTTPDCTEGVVWTVFEHPIPLGKEQVRHLY